MRPLPCLLLAAAFATATGALAAVEPVDGCATVLGSIAIELRHARGLPPGRKSQFACAKRYSSVHGASRERVLRALGAPDREAPDGGWSYFFASRYAQMPAGTAEIVFRFGGEGVVESVDCRRTTA